MHNHAKPFLKNSHYVGYAELLNGAHRRPRLSSQPDHNSVLVALIPWVAPSHHGVLTVLWLALDVRTGPSFPQMLRLVFDTTQSAATSFGSSESAISGDFWLVRRS